MEKDKGGLNSLERIGIINEMVAGNPLSERELGVIKGLVEDYEDELKKVAKLEREIGHLERVNMELMGELNDEYEREERDYFLDDDNWD